MWFFYKENWKQNLDWKEWYRNPSLDFFSSFLSENTRLSPCHRSPGRRQQHRRHASSCHNLLDPSSPHAAKPRPTKTNRSKAPADEWPLRSRHTNAVSWRHKWSQDLEKQRILNIRNYAFLLQVILTKSVGVLKLGRQITKHSTVTSKRTPWCRALLSCSKSLSPIRNYLITP